MNRKTIQILNDFAHLQLGLTFYSDTYKKGVPATIAVNDSAMEVFTPDSQFDLSFTEFKVKSQAREVIRITSKAGGERLFLLKR